LRNWKFHERVHKSSLIPFLSRPEEITASNKVPVEEEALAQLRKKFTDLYETRKSITVTCFGCSVNRNHFYFLVFLFTSLHVSASTGHPQVEHTQSFLKLLSLQRIRF
jgi:hypothetical protein